MAEGELEPPAGMERGGFAPSVLYAAAKLYYLENATQAEVAQRIGTSRATVSRLLAQARAQGIVRIEVIPPADDEHLDLAEELRDRLGLTRVFLSDPLPTPQPGRAIEEVMGSYLAAAVGRALESVQLAAGDVLLVSSGRTMYEVAQFELAKKPEVLVAPTVGGNDQPEEWYQTNEITRLMANRIGGRAMYLFAPALPGADLYRTLRADPSIQRVLDLWPQAKCVLMGVGGPPRLRTHSPKFMQVGTADLEGAVGDICARFFDHAGAQIPFPGSDRLMAIELESLPKIPVAIAVASGRDKVDAIVAGARARYFNHLVTDPRTAQQLLASREGE